MKKVVLSLLAVLSLCACTSAPAETKGPKIEVSNSTINAVVGQTKADFKNQICESVTLINTAGEEVGCEYFYYTTPVATVQAGEYDFTIAYKDGDAVAEATLKLVVSAE